VTNPLPPELEREGWLAYEQARAFESLRRRRLPVVYAGLTALLIVMGLVACKVERPVLGTVFLAVAILFPIVAWNTARFFRFRHDENLQRLAALKARYGENLPWLEVERHMAAVAELQNELARQKTGTEEPPA
jgi:hypothetical protein